MASRSRRSYHGAAGVQSKSCRKTLVPSSSAMTALVWWRRWESKTSDFEPIHATTGNHGKPDPELQETKDSEKHVREHALPAGKIERELQQGRADVGETPTAETLGSLARKVLSSSRHAESRELLARASAPPVSARRSPQKHCGCASPHRGVADSRGPQSHRRRHGAASEPLPLTSGDNSSRSIATGEARET